jgi:hypothetical protein
MAQEKTVKRENNSMFVFNPPKIKIMKTDLFAFGGQMESGLKKLFEDIKKIEKKKGE